MVSACHAIFFSFRKRDGPEIVFDREYLSWHHAEAS